jgi:hypothetical protein
MEFDPWLLLPVSVPISGIGPRKKGIQDLYQCPTHSIPAQGRFIDLPREISFLLRLPPCEQPLFLLSVEKPSNLVLFSNSYFIFRLFAGTSDLTCSSFFH